MCRKGRSSAVWVDSIVKLAPSKVDVQEAILIANATKLRFTSSSTGTLHGSGESWWGYAQYLLHGEDRPRLFSLVNATDILVEHWRFEQSPYVRGRSRSVFDATRVESCCRFSYWTFTAFDVARLYLPARPHRIQTSNTYIKEQTRIAHPRHAQFHARTLACAHAGPRAPDAAAMAAGC